MGKLEGKVAVVTGGSSGLGRAIARRFVAEGARVVIGDIADEAGQEVAKSLGDSARYRHCDVTRADDIEALVRSAPEQWGRLDIMVNNAGAVGAHGSILDITPDEWGATMGLLLNSVFFGIRSAGRVLVDQGEGGSIISMASIAAFTPGNGPHVYGTAKAAVVHLTQRVSLEARRAAHPGERDLPRRHRHPAGARRARSRRGALRHDEGGDRIDAPLPAPRQPRRHRRRRHLAGQR